MDTCSFFKIQSMNTWINLTLLKYNLIKNNWNPNAICTSSLPNFCFKLLLYITKIVLYCCRYSIDYSPLLSPPPPTGCTFRYNWNCLRSHQLFLVLEMQCTYLYKIGKQFFDYPIKSVKRIFLLHMLLLFKAGIRQVCMSRRRQIIKNVRQSYNMYIIFHWFVNC